MKLVGTAIQSLPLELADRLWSSTSEAQTNDIFYAEASRALRCLHKLSAGPAGIWNL